MEFPSTTASDDVMRAYDDNPIPEEVDFSVFSPFQPFGATYPEQSEVWQAQVFPLEQEGPVFRTDTTGAAPPLDSAPSSLPIVSIAGGALPLLSEPYGLDTSWVLDSTQQHGNIPHDAAGPSGAAVSSIPWTSSTPAPAPAFGMGEQGQIASNAPLTNWPIETAPTRRLSRPLPMASIPSWPPVAAAVQSLLPETSIVGWEDLTRSREHARCPLMVWGVGEGTRPGHADCGTIELRDAVTSPGQPQKPTACLNLVDDPETVHLNMQRETVLPLFDAFYSKIAAGMVPVFEYADLRHLVDSLAHTNPSQRAAQLQRPPRSISNAIVLIALGLGKICTSADGPLPDVTKVGGARRNFQVIPGLDYVAIAKDIVDSQACAFDLQIVYAKLLLAVYYAQLSRVYESLRYIADASWTLREMLPPVVQAEHNELVIAYWSCLIMENDILDVLPTQKSTLADRIGYMPLPKLGEDTATGDKAAFATRCRQYQLLHWAPQLPDPFPLDRLFREIRQNLPARFAYGLDIAFPAFPTTANGASLQFFVQSTLAKIYRRFIALLLFRSSNTETSEPEAQHQALEKIRECAHMGIGQLVASLQAFKALTERRPIIMNPWAVGHAQFCNLLLVTAVFRNQRFGYHIGFEELRGLYFHTVRFLDAFAQPSSILYDDLRVIVALARELFSATYRPSEGLYFP